MRYLLDTNILSEPAKPAPRPSLLEKFQHHRKHLCTAAPVWHELLFGVRRLPASRRRRRLEAYLHEVVATSMEILPYDSAAADQHAEERARLTQLGKPPTFVDGQIAAIAQVHGLILVTHNGAHFSMFRGLQVEDWPAG
jgi:tRNA(fMet)-specific endonuclease VapC